MNIKVKQEFIKLSSADRIQINLRCLVFRGHQEEKMYLWQALTLNVSLNPLQAIRVLLLPDALVHLKNPQKHIEWSFRIRVYLSRKKTIWVWAVLNLTGVLMASSHTILNDNSGINNIWNQGKKLFFALLGKPLDFSRICFFFHPVFDFSKAIKNGFKAGETCLSPAWSQTWNIFI